MKKETLHIALFQQDIAWEQPQENRALVERAFEEALHGSETDLLVVPETFTTGFGDQMARLAEPPHGATFDFALHMARKHNALFAGSWTVNEGGTIFNRLHLVQPDGSCTAYDKAHTFRMSSEAGQLARGTRRVEACWRGWRIRPAVCYDLRFPLWLRNSPSLDYDLLLVCANWPGSRHEAWSTLLKARAIENLAYVAGCNRVGTDGTGIAYAGCSAIVDFKGQTMAADTPQDTTAGGTVLQATLHAEAIDTFRRHWPFNLDFDRFNTLTD